MKYYIDTEFLEGPQKEKFPISLFRKNTPPTIDLISIGIVAEDGREYYAISKDFNMEEAWNRYDLKLEKGDYSWCFGTKNSPVVWVSNKNGRFFAENKIYWIRENVLKPVWRNLFFQADIENQHYSKRNADSFLESVNLGLYDDLFSYKSLKWLLNRYGKTNKQIAEEVKSFCSMGSAYSTMDKTIASIMYFSELDSEVQKTIEDKKLIHVFNEKPEFYAYYADYDWVVFCWLFGKMMDLPSGFPMYCKDLKQDFDFYNENFKKRKKLNAVGNIHKSINELKDFKDFPKQDPSKSHNAIEDARWNKQLHDFLKKI